MRVKKSMQISQAVKALTDQDRKGQYVFTMRQLRKLFPQDSDRAFSAGLKRLSDSGILTRATKGVYVYELAANKGRHVLEHIAKAMRGGEYSYISMESALSEYGRISQVPIDRLTVMTTGRKGEYKTPYGIIEFTHTSRPVREIVQRMVEKDRPLRIAKEDAAVSDLRRTGRNLHLLTESGA